MVVMGTPQRKKVLIVDDEPSITRALSRMIKVLSGYDSVLANNGEQGIKLFNPSEIGLLISDVQMRPIDGPSMVESLYQQYNDVWVPAYFMTANAGSFQDKVDYLITKGIVTGVIDKPVNTDYLVSLVQQALGNSQ